MGLGLKVCRTIIAAHGGELACENNAGKGATFHFTLPGSGQGPGASGGPEQRRPELPPPLATSY
jgi:K+-sensing histidine kinase KdpD